jgi:hypothetical protein
LKVNVGFEIQQNKKLELYSIILLRKRGGNINKNNNFRPQDYKSSGAGVNSIEPANKNYMINSPNTNFDPSKPQVGTNTPVSKVAPVSGSNLKSTSTTITKTTKFNK